MVGRHTGPNEKITVFVVRQEAPHSGHVALSERLWQSSFVEHHQVVLEITDDELIFQGALLH